MKKILVLILLSLLLIGCARNNCTVVTEPYEEVEEYTEEEEYTEDTCEYMEFAYELDNIDSRRIGDTVRLEYDMTNLDTEKMEFRGGANWILGDSAVMARFDPNVCCRYTVEPGETITVRKEYSEAPNGLKGEPNIIVPEKEFCGEITKTRTITRNRTVTKYRDKTVCE